MSDFVTNAMVQTALEYLGLDPHPIALARGELTRAENEKKERRARAFLGSQLGTVSARECEAETSQDYISAGEREANAVEAVEAARAKLNWCNCIIETWRTQAANVRASERIR